MSADTKKEKEIKVGDILIYTFCDHEHFLLITTIHCINKEFGLGTRYEVACLILSHPDKTYIGKLETRSCVYPNNYSFYDSNNIGK